MGISFGAVQSILSDILGMSKVSARLVPGMLTDDQKRTWFDISRYLWSHYEDDTGNFIQRVVTQDETWVHHLTKSKKCRANNGSTLKYKRVHLADRALRSLFWGYSSGDHD